MENTFLRNAYPKAIENDIYSFILNDYPINQYIRLNFPFFEITRVAELFSMGWNCNDTPESLRFWIKDMGFDFDFSDPISLTQPDTENPHLRYALLDLFMGQNWFAIGEYFIAAHDFQFSIHEAVKANDKLLILVALENLALNYLALPYCEGCDLVINLVPKNKNYPLDFYKKYITLELMSKALSDEWDEVHRIKNEQKYSEPLYSQTNRLLSDVYYFTNQYHKYVSIISDRWNTCWEKTNQLLKQ